MNTHLFPKVVESGKYQVRELKPSKGHLPEVRAERTKGNYKWWSQFSFSEDYTPVMATRINS